MPGPKPKPRLPYEALVPFLGEDRDDATVAEMVGVARSTVLKWKRVGLTPWHADAVAILLGLHPLVVWGDEWAEAIDELVARAS